ncbi:MAG TPA: hypothetical protein VEQ85_00935 [Lacipirellulaceae bacterium]|nr:hypothetical protein [Lacipirellulaceae bacterium]
MKAWTMAATAVFAACLPTARAQEPIAGLTNDPQIIQRFDPLSTTMVNVVASEIKPGYLYHRYHAGLARRVWSVAAPGGGFLYAMAPGSTQPAWMLDLRATPEQLRNELDARVPGLLQLMDTRGAAAFVRLTTGGTWELVPRPTIANVYDLETLRRWEWHGPRRVAVMHTSGYEWLQVNGQFVPALAVGMAHYW